MHYDPIKDRLGGFFSQRPLLQKGFYRGLDLFFLRAWHVHRALDDLFRRLPRDREIRVLDAGTGFAQYADYIARTQPRARILAVDVKDDYLDNARRYFATTPYADRVTFAIEDLTDLQADGPFDLILSVDVMEHIEDDRGVFRHFARVLAPGGFVVVNTPSDQGGSDVQGEGDASFISEHVRDGYNRDDLISKLHEAGLGVEDVRYTYGRYGGAAWRWMIQRPMKMMNRSMASAALLPFYYAPVLPVGLALHALDVRTRNPTGTGLLAIARKPVA